MLLSDNLKAIARAGLVFSVFTGITLGPRATTIYGSAVLSVLRL